MRLELLFVMCHWTKCFMSAHVYIRSPSGFGPQYRFSVKKYWELRIRRTILWDSSFYTIFSAKNHKPDFWKLTFWKGVCSKSKHEMETRQDPCGDMFRANATRTWYTALVTLVPEVFLRREERREREKRRENLSSESGVLAPIYPGCCSISNPIRRSKAPG